MNHDECVRDAIKGGRFGKVQNRAKSILVARVDGKLFQAPAFVISYPGTDVVIARQEIDGYTHIMDFAVDTDVCNGAHLIQLFDDGGKVTTGYSIEKEGEPSINYVADLGGANIDFNQNGLLYGDYIARLKKGYGYVNVTNAQFLISPA